MNTRSVIAALLLLLFVLYHLPTSFLPPSLPPFLSPSLSPYPPSLPTSSSHSLPLKSTILTLSTSLLTKRRPPPNDWVLSTNRVWWRLGNWLSPIHPFYLRYYRFWLRLKRRITKKRKNNTWNLVEMRYYSHFCCAKTVSHAGELHQIYVFWHLIYVLESFYSYLWDTVQLWCINRSWYYMLCYIACCFSSFLSPSPPLTSPLPFSSLVSLSFPCHLSFPLLLPPLLISPLPSQMPLSSPSSPILPFILISTPSSPFLPFPY